MQSSNQYVRTPVVRYYRKMRVGRIHPLKVTLSTNGVPSLGFQSSNGAFDPPVVIQVTVPGAIVTPPHVIVPLAGGEASFYVQPLMAGRLVGAKVEFLSQGRKMSEVALPMKANRGRLAKYLFLFALVLPFLINFFPDLSFTDKVRKEVAPVPEKKPLPASLMHDAAPVLFITTQPPKDASKDTQGTRKETKPEARKETKPETSKETKPEARETRPPMPGGGVMPPKRGLSGLPDAQSPTPGPAHEEMLITYHGEDAIWAWVRHRLHRQGYQTKMLPQSNPDTSTEPKAEPNALQPVLELVNVNRRYEITNEGAAEWSTSKVLAMGLYYAEPILRGLYRTFIVFPNPQHWPLGDLIFGLIFLTLAALVWMMTNPTRRTLRGPVLNIHVGS